ncbi:hypothetical protein HII31_10298 [Pseudocercospora fuligena]|uniref:Uncharacterized protein n=1 Tax=Pseudocercospora fuligena TaxID=685502 RepID=A0A8H6RCK9_9PEZI|nr:hypothetical protein HII31_10298 [Pseudocercospora fuligena]
MNQDLGQSIWSISAPATSGNENARPTQPTGAAPTAPKHFAFNTSTATNNNVDTTSSTTRGRAIPTHVQGAAREPSPALSTSSATSSRADAAIADMSNAAPRGPLLFNPQQAKLLRSDPDWQETPPAAPLPQATARDDDNVGGEAKAPKIESTVNSTSTSIAANPAVTLRQPTSSSSSSSSGDKLVAAMKAKMIQMAEAEDQAKKTNVETPAAPPAASGPSTLTTAAAPVLPPPPAFIATKPATAETSGVDWKADIMTKAAAVEKKVEPDYIPPHKRVKAASEKPAEPLKTEPKVQPKVEPKAEIMVEPKIEPKAEPKAEIKTEIKTEPKLEPFAAASKPTYTPEPTAMPTPAASPASSGDAAYFKRLADFEAVAKQNPARAAMKWDELQEENTILQELITFQQEYEALAAKRVEMNAKIDSAMASKKECIARCLNMLSIFKKMRIEEEQQAKEHEAKLKGLKQEE